MSGPELARLPLRPPLEPMEATSRGAIPDGNGWQYEPKWDGFRCLAYRDGDELYLQSKAGDPFARYFPEIVEQLHRIAATPFVLDGELVIRDGGALSFDRLLLRIHPAASRVRKLAAEHPATFIAFDLLVGHDGSSLADRPLRERRATLEAFARAEFAQAPLLRLSPATSDPDVARRWFHDCGGSLDGVIAKRLDCRYLFGDRSGVVKVKHARTADCVVGGFRYASNANAVGSLLLGLYDAEGRLHHVGFTSSFSAAERKSLLAKVEPLIEPPGFTGNRPGGPSRWSTRRSDEWQPLRPSLVLEVGFDHVTAGRFRHGTRPLRWRPDKAPAQCTMEQLRQPVGARMLDLLDAPDPAGRGAAGVTRFRGCGLR